MIIETDDRMVIPSLLARDFMKHLRRLAITSDVAIATLNNH